MYVAVRYYKGNGIYAGREYGYHTGMLLVEGDKVIAPTAKEPRQRAIVTRICIDPPGFACKEITEYDPEGEVASVSGGRQHG